jgi:hypothetical protein
VKDPAATQRTAGVRPLTWIAHGFETGPKRPFGVARTRCVTVEIEVIHKKRSFQARKFPQPQRKSTTGTSDQRCPITADLAKMGLPLA